MAPRDPDGGVRCVVDGWSTAIVSVLTVAIAAGASLIAARIGAAATIESMREQMANASREQAEERRARRQERLALAQTDYLNSVVAAAKRFVAFMLAWFERVGADCNEYDGWGLYPDGPPMPPHDFLEYRRLRADLLMAASLVADMEVRASATAIVNSVQAMFGVATCQSALTHYWAMDAAQLALAERAGNHLRSL